MQVNFYCTASGRNLIVEYLRRQTIHDRDGCFEHIALLRKYGFDLPAQLIKKLKGQKRLWELRVSASTQHRFLFTTSEHQSILILHAFTKKSQKTPIKELKSAQNRLRNKLK